MEYETRSPAAIAVARWRLRNLWLPSTDHSEDYCIGFHRISDKILPDDDDDDDDEEEEVEEEEDDDDDVDDDLIFKTRLSRLIPTRIPT